MTEDQADTRCQIEVESKDSNFIKILVVATTEKRALKLFKDVRQEITKKVGVSR